MSKQYEEPENAPMMASEPVAAYAYATVDKSPETGCWDSDDAPCRYTIDELQEIISQGEKEIARGNFHTNTEVQQMVLNKIQAWR